MIRFENKSNIGGNISQYWEFGLKPLLEKEHYLEKTIRIIRCEIRSRRIRNKNKMVKSFNFL